VKLTHFASFHTLIWQKVSLSVELVNDIPFDVFTQLKKMSFVNWIDFVELVVPFEQVTLNLCAP